MMAQLKARDYLLAALFVVLAVVHLIAIGLARQEASGCGDYRVHEHGLEFSQKMNLGAIRHLDGRLFSSAARDTWALLAFVTPAEAVDVLSALPPVRSIGGHKVELYAVIVAPSRLAAKIWSVMLPRRLRDSNETCMYTQTTVY